MPRQYSSRDIRRALEKHGYVFVTQRGSHQKFRRVGSPTRTVILPAGRKEVPPGTLRSILRQADLSAQELDEVL